MMTKAIRTAATVLFVMAFVVGLASFVSAVVTLAGGGSVGEPSLTPRWALIALGFGCLVGGFGVVGRYIFGMDSAERRLLASDLLSFWPRLSGYQWALYGLLVGGAALRIFGLADSPLTYDESFTALIVRRPLADLLTAAAGDVHPPLSYLIYWAFVRVFAGGAVNALTLRIIPAVLGSFSIMQVLHIGRRIGLGRPALLVGVALFALSPYELTYSQDARMYTMLQFCILGAVLALVERRYLVMGAWLAGAVWLHNYGWFYLAVLGLAALVQELRRPVLYTPSEGIPWQSASDQSQIGPVLAAVGGAALLGAPWLGVLGSQVHTLKAGYWIPSLTLGQLVYPLFPLLWGVHVPEALNLMAAAVGFGLAAFAILKAWRARAHRLLVWLILGPMALAALASIVVLPIYLYRGFVGVLGPLLLLLAWAVVEGVALDRRVWAVALVLPILFVTVAQRQELAGVYSGDNARALNVVLAGYEPGDIIYHGNVGTYSGFVAAGPAWLPNYLMTVQPGSVGELTPQTRRALAMCEGWLEPELMTTCGGAPATWRRAWLVWGAAQTISGAEDAAIASLLARYPNTRLLDIREVYKGVMPVDGGIWLLTPAP